MSRQKIVQCYHQMQLKTLQEKEKVVVYNKVVIEGSYHIYKSQRLVSGTYLGGFWFGLYAFRDQEKKTFRNVKS